MAYAAYRMEWALDETITLPQHPILIEGLLRWSLNQDARWLSHTPPETEELMPLERLNEGGLKRWMASALHFSRNAQDVEAPRVQAIGGAEDHVGFVRGWFIGDAVVVERLITRVAHVGDIGDWHLGTHLTRIAPDETARTRWRQQGTAEGHEALDEAVRQAIAQSSVPRPAH